MTERMLIAEYHVPAGMVMEPPEEVARLVRLRRADLQVEVLPGGVQHVRWWLTPGPPASLEGLARATGIYDPSAVTPARSSLGDA